ncbi:MAG: segregation/condensation protein A [Clostridia bacterium]|nr:segregation/condensation protein A [Clostridia bacterium]MBQ3067196.1 segregation/condensation protein A [Clostridia bacterium]
MIENYEQQYIFDEEDTNALQLNLDNYSGPLDLLLDLVKENKIEIKDIFVSQVTEQFLQYMSEFSKLDVDKASEYMEMAARLLEIKSRALLPVLEAVADEDDPKKVLIRQLEEYKLFKEVVSELKGQQNVDRFYREPDKSVGKEVSVLKENLSVEGFMQAFGKFLLKMQARVNVENVSRTMVKENFSVPQKVRYLQEILQTEQSFNFSELFNESTSKNELITTFIAVLELLKLQYIFVKQKGLFEDFIIEKRPDAQDLQVNLEGEYEQTE